MRIVFYSDDFYPLLSGIADSILTTGKELKKRGHEIMYVAARYPAGTYISTKSQPPADISHEEVSGMPVFRVPSLHLPGQPIGRVHLSPPLRTSLSFVHAWKPDIIHTQSPWGVGIEARMVARDLGIPLMGTNHTAIEDFFPFGMRGAMRRWDAHYYNHCSFVTAPYAKLIDRMREKGFTKPGRAVANPAELAAFTPATPEERVLHKRTFGLTGPVVLYAGRLGVEKRVDVIVRAIALLIKDFPTITLVATGHGAAENALKTLAQELGIGKNITFIGFLSRAELPHVYKTAEVFAMMSTSDSQSIALMQAYSSGVPAVCARARGLPDYTPGDAGFLVEPGDHAALAEKIKLLLDDSALRERMGSSAVAFVKQFSPEKIAAEWEGVYRGAIDRLLS